MAQSPVMTAIIGAVALLAILGVGYFAVSKYRAYQRRNRTQDTQRRMREESEPGVRGRESVGFVTRARSQTWAMKLLVASVLVGILFVLYQVYHLMQSGSPNEWMYARQTQLVVYGLIVGVASIYFVKKQNGKAGELEVTIEGDTNRSVTFYYQKNLVEPITDSEGNRTGLLLPLFKRNRTFGLFWRPMLSVDRDDLRDRDHRLPRDRVIFRVEEDGSTSWNEHHERINLRAKDLRPLDEPSTNADLEAVPTDRKSRTEVQRIRDEKEEAERELKHEKRMNAVLSEQLREMEEAFENLVEDSKRDFREDIGLITQLLSSLSGGRGANARQIDPEQLENMENGLSFPGDSDRAGTTQDD